MSIFRLFIITIALVALYLGAGLIGLILDIESIKITRFGLFLCALMGLAAGFTFWVEWQEKKERRDGQNPSDQ